MLNIFLYVLCFNFNFNNNFFIKRSNSLRNNKISIALKFEEEDFNIDSNFFNKTLPSKKGDITFNMNKEVNEEEIDIFPSFYDFLRERELKEIKKKDNYLNSNKNIEPSSKDLKILSSMSAVEWTRTWVYEMIHVPDFFPTFMFHDMFRMRDFAQKNNSKHYFYIGYYPSDSNLKKGPYYIGAFELIPPMREFRTYLIIQNPYYCAETNYDDMKIKNFKKELLAMTNDACVFFKFDNLRDTSDQRYFYSWCYEE